MQIADVARHYDNSITDNTAGAVKNQGVESTVSNVQGMKVGHVFEGTINGVKNGQVQIGLSNGETLTARLDSGISIAKGQSLFFQVKSNENGQIQIRAITGESGTNPTLEKALNAASLPINDRNIAMVKTMMEEKMSIDSNSLISMYRSMAGSGGADPVSVVQMAKYGIPITPELAAQFENYKMDQGAILKELTNVMNELPDLVSSATVSAEQGAALNHDIVEILTGGSPDLSIPATIASLAPAETQALAEAEAQIAEGSLVTSNQELVMPKDELLAAAEQALFDEAVIGQENADIVVLQADNLEEIISQGEVVDADEADAIAKSSQQLLEELSTRIESFTYTTDAIGGYASPQTIIDLSETIKSIPALAQSLEQLFTQDGYLDPKITSQVLLKELTAALDQGVKDGSITKEDVSKLLGGEGYKASIRNLVEKQWLLEPSEVAQGTDTIKKLYSRLETQMNQIDQALAKAAVPHQEFTAQTVDVSNNISFMNELNAAYTYVQIPLKLSGQNANGDLYVYTNKKKLQDPDSELTAFLHFDMENLGPTDVSVKMLHKNVTTHFYLANEDAFELIENNIHILDNRLREKGYSCNINVSNEDNKPDFVSDFLKHDDKTVGQVHRYSFDVRA